MFDAFTILMAVLFFSCVPAGLIFLALGIFSRAPRRCMVCGYDRHGLPLDAICPECAADHTASTGKKIPRVNWQVRLGAVLLTASGLPLLFLIAVLVRQVI